MDWVANSLNRGEFPEFTAVSRLWHPSCDCSVFRSRRLRQREKLLVSDTLSRAGRTLKRSLRHEGDRGSIRPNHRSDEATLCRQIGLRSASLLKTRNVDMRLLTLLGSGSAVVLAISVLGCNSGPPPQHPHPSHQQVYHHPQQAQPQQVQPRSGQSSPGAMPSQGGTSPSNPSSPMSPATADPQNGASPQGFGPTG